MVEGATRGAGSELADELDKYIVSIIESGAEIDLDTTSSNKLELDGTNGLETISKIVEEMDTANAPEGNRFIVIPPFVARLFTMELAGKITQNANIIQSGYIGSVFGLNVFKSNNVTSILCGCSEGITLAQQIDEVESVRLPDSFGTGVRGLHVYGAKVTRPAIFGNIYVEESSS